jgi:hypothetical protein
VNRTWLGALLLLAGCDIGGNLGCLDGPLLTGPSSSGSSCYSAPLALPAPSADLVVSGLAASPNPVQALSPFALAFSIRIPPDQRASWSLTTTSTRGTSCIGPKSGDVTNGGLDARIDCEAGAPEDVVFYVVAVSSNSSSRNTAILTVRVR